MSRLNDKPREFKQPRRRLIRWATRGEVPASVVGFHRVPDPRAFSSEQMTDLFRSDRRPRVPERLVQGAMSVQLNLRGEGRIPAEAHNLGLVGSTPTPATKP